MCAKKNKNFDADQRVANRPPKVCLDGTIYVAEEIPEVVPRRGRGRPPKNAATNSQSKQNQRKNVQQQHEYESEHQHQSKSTKALIDQLLSRVAALEEEIRQLKTQKAAPAQNTLVERTSLVNVVAKEQREREIKAKNVVVRGLKLADETNSNADQVATAATKTVQQFVARVTADSAIPVNVSKVHCLPQSKSVNLTNELPITYAAVVVLESDEQQRALLKVARRHNLQDEEFKGVFAHEDRTKAQQLQHRESLNEARAKNTELDRRGLLDKPFRYVVRAGGVRCIDVDQSSKQKRSIYRSPPNANTRVETSRFVNVNNRRGTVSKSVHSAEMFDEANGKDSNQ